MAGITRLGRLSAVAASVAAALLLMHGAASADSSSYGGALDPTFGTAGIATTRFADIGFTAGTVAATAVQADGKILVGGTLTSTTTPSLNSGWVIARYNADGSPDSGFGTNGLVTTCVGSDPACTNNSADTPTVDSVLAEPNGDILAVGVAPQGVTLVQYNPDGSLDQSFGVGGISPDPNGTNSPPPEDRRVRGALLQPDGKVLVLIGGGVVDGVFAPAGIARFNADGTPDQSFGTDGTAQTPPPPDNCSCGDEFDSIAQSPDGSISIGGQRNYRATDGEYVGRDAIAGRFNADGSLDSGFASGSLAVIPLGSGPPNSSSIVPFPMAMAVESDGSIVLGDEYVPPGGGISAPRLIGLNADGTLNTSFGTNGIEIATPLLSWDPFLYGAYALIAQPDGKVIAVGDGDDATTFNTGFGIERFMPDGAPDPTFGVDGVAVVTYAQSTYANARVATLTPDGKLVVIGVGWTTTADAWLRMRYLLSGTTPITVDERGASRGTVRSAPRGIACNGTYGCSAQFAALSKVTLTASPPSGKQVFWDGACAASVLVCRVTADAATRQVNVTFSPPGCVVPHVIRTALSSARSVLIRNDCTVGTVTKAFSKTIPAGSVISTTPAAGVWKRKGWPVVLVVSKGATPPLCVVPQVIGMTLGSAKTAILKHGCTTGTVTYAFSNTVPSGYVVSTKPKAGVQEPARAPVALVVSKGPQG